MCDNCTLGEQQFECVGDPAQFVNVTYRGRTTRTKVDERAARRRADLHVGDVVGIHSIMFGCMGYGTIERLEGTKTRLADRGVSVTVEWSPCSTVFTHVCKDAKKMLLVGEVRHCAPASIVVARRIEPPVLPQKKRAKRG